MRNVPRGYMGAGGLAVRLLVIKEDVGLIGA
jgi:hypothetical protein